MKRVASSLLVTASVPLGVLFALTAWPARLYAEAAPPLVDSGVQACTGKAIADPCTYGGSSGVCVSTAYPDPDGGADAAWVTSVSCLLGSQSCVAVQPQAQACTGKFSGNNCALVSGEADSGVCVYELCVDPDGGWGQPLLCEPPQPPWQPDSGNADVWQPADSGDFDAWQPVADSGDFDVWQWPVDAAGYDAVVVQGGDAELPPSGADAGGLPQSDGGVGAGSYDAAPPTGGGGGLPPPSGGDADAPGADAGSGSLDGSGNAETPPGDQGGCNATGAPSTDALSAGLGLLLALGALLGLRQRRTK